MCRYNSLFALYLKHCKSTILQVFFFFEKGNENVLWLCSVDSCTTLWLYQKPLSEKPKKEKHFLKKQELLVGSLSEQVLTETLLCKVLS